MPEFNPHAPASAARCLLAALVALALAATQIVDNRTPDFLQDYGAAWAWRHGRPADERTAVAANEFWPVHEFPEVDWLRQSHPPLATLLAWPLTQWEFVTARWLWAVASAVCIAAAWRIVRTPFSLCLATAPMWAVALVLGTHEPLLAALIAGGAACLDRRPRWAGALLGLATAVKVYPVVLLIGLALGRRWTSAIAAGIVVVVSFVIGEGLFGAGYTERWLDFTAANMGRYIDASQNGSLVRWLRLTVPIAPSLGALAIVAALGASDWRRLTPALSGSRPDGVQSRSLVLSWIPIMLLASPLSWRHYAAVTGLLPLSTLEQGLVAMAGALAFLVGSGALASVPEVLIQTPLLSVLLWQWGRARRA